MIRIANKDSLDIVNLPCEVSEAYGDISDAVDIIKDPITYLPDFWREHKKEPTVKEDKTFSLEKPDIVLINPPFTRLQNLPVALRKQSPIRCLNDICGNKINYWGYFLAHADRILKAGGKIGAIIPDSFLRGERTQKIREHIITNYSVDYIIKPPEGYCFSEDSEFGDIIIIAKKCQPEENHETRLVFLHGDILKRSPEDVKDLIRKILAEIGNKVEYEKFSIRKIKQKELINNRHNLSPFFFSNNVSAQDKVNLFVTKIRANGFMEKMNRTLMEAGFQLRGVERPKESVITRNLGESRLSKAKYYFSYDTESDFLEYFDKADKCHKIQKNRLTRTFRTCVDVDTFNITSKHDYFIHEKNHKKKSSNLIIPSRVELISENTHALGFYDEERISPLDTFVMYMCSTKEESKLTCLYVQSVFFIAQLLTVAKMSRGEGAFANYVEIKLDYLQEIYAPTFDKIDKAVEGELFEYFEQFKDKKLPSLVKQMAEKNSDRIKLDLLLNNALKLGFSKSDIEGMYEIISQIIR